MPALVKSSVGSLAGTSEDECTRRCPFDSKNLRKASRMADPDQVFVLEDISMQVYRGTGSDKAVSGETVSEEAVSRKRPRLSGYANQHFRAGGLRHAAFGLDRDGASLRFPARRHMRSHHLASIHGRHHAQAHRSAGGGN